MRYLILAACVFAAFSCAKDKMEDSFLVETPARVGDRYHSVYYAKSGVSFSFETAGHSQWQPLSIRISWGDGDTTDWLLNKKRGELVKAAHSWHRPGKYVIRAQARDGQGVTSWSDSATLIVKSKSPKILWRRLPGFTVREIMVSPNGYVYAGLNGKYQAAYDCHGDSADISNFNPRLIEPPYRNINIVFNGWDRLRNRYGYITVEEDGIDKWRYDLGCEVTTKFIFDNEGNLYFGTNRDELYSIRPDGKLRWRQKLTGSHVNGLTIGKDGMLYAASYNVVYAYTGTGVLRWSFEADLDVFCSPAVGDDGSVFFGSDYKTVYAVDKNGMIKWTYAAGARLRSNPCVDNDGTLYIGTDDGTLFAINPDGTEQWSFRCGAKIRSDIRLIENNLVCFGTEDSCLYALKIDTD